MKWTTEKPTKPGWYWWRWNAHSEPHVTRLQQGQDDSDNESFFYARESSFVPSNAMYIKEGQWAGPIPEPEET